MDGVACKGSRAVCEVRGRAGRGYGELAGVSRVGSEQPPPASYPVSSEFPKSAKEFVKK